MSIPGLTVEARQGVDRVIVDFDRGDREAAFSLLMRALPALRDLDRRTRTGRAETTDEDGKG